MKWVKKVVQRLEKKVNSSLSGLSSLSSVVRYLEGYFGRFYF